MPFSDVPGQSRAKRFLGRLLRSDQVPHAMLFSGMGGSGKSAMAQEFFKRLNCQAPGDPDPCEACASCLKIRNGTHPDWVTVRADGAFIKLDQIRELRERLRFQPFEGKWRGILVEKAHTLREEAANALLKILEEPPRKNLFLLTTLEPQMVMPTILSRCCHVRFQPLEREELAQILAREAPVTEAQALHLARLADGSMERAKWLADETRMGCWRETVERLQNLGNLTMLEFFPLMAQWVQQSESLDQEFEWFKLWMRDLILCGLPGQHESYFTPDEKSRKAAMAAGIDTLFELYEAIENALLHLRRNANKSLVLEGVCLAIKDRLYGKSCGNPVPQGRQSLSF